MGLPYLHQAMRVWGHTYGLEVTLMDGDMVSETNCVRQPFSWSDVGQNKAIVLINRINLFWGTKWNAQPTCFDETTLQSNHDRSPDILIACVDTKAARNVIERSYIQEIEFCRVLARSREWCIERSIRSRPATQRQEPSQGGPATNGRVNSIRRLPMLLAVKTHCPVAPRPRRWNGKNHSSIRLSRQAP